MLHPERYEYPVSKSDFYDLKRFSGCRNPRDSLKWAIGFARRVCELSTPTADGKYILNIATPYAGDPIELLLNYPAFATPYEENCEPPRPTAVPYLHIIK